VEVVLFLAVATIGLPLIGAGLRSLVARWRREKAGLSASGV
jgi:hypothetical protein